MSDQLREDQMSIKPLGLASLLLVTACLEAGEPVVADYNGRIVKVQYHPYALGDDYEGSPVHAKAAETCSLDGREEAIYQGVRRVSEYAGEHVFLCR